MNDVKCPLVFVTICHRTCSATNSANLRPMFSSSKSTAPRSVVPRVIAFLWFVTNCRLILCISDNVTIRGGRRTDTLVLLDRGMKTDPPSGCELDMETIAETTAAVVCSRICNASDGAFTT